MIFPPLCYALLHFATFCYAVLKYLLSTSLFDGFEHSQIEQVSGNFGCRELVKGIQSTLIARHLQM